jgi:hypothetical protein
LFGCIFDDDGQRRPLLIELPGTNTYARLKASDKNAGALEMVRQVAKLLEKEVGKVEGRDDGNWRAPGE